MHVPGNLGGLLGAELEVLGALDGQLGAALARLALQAQNDLLGGLGLVSQRSSTREASEKRFQARSRIAWAARQAHTGMPRWKRLPSRHNHVPPHAEPRTHLLVEHGLGLATVTLLLVLVPAGTLGELGGLASLVLGNLVHLVLTALLALAVRTASLGDVHLNWVADGRQEVSQRLVCTAASTPRASHKRHTARHFMHRHITRRARPAAAVQAHRSDSRCTHHAGHMPCMMAANRTAHSRQNTGNTRTHGTRSTTPHAPS